MARTPNSSIEPVDILLIDDRAEDLLTLEHVLAGPEYRVQTARSGSEALRRLLEQDFAVILLDVFMPVMDGFELASLIKQRERSQHTPIIFMTAAGSDLSQIYRGYSLGAVEYLNKPVQGLSGSRGSMRSISLDERPLEQLEWPETVAHRLLAQLAPVVMEIARRSGAAGELVLRRDVVDGRREEIYVTKADLWERLLVLPPERRIPFAALGLSPPLAASLAAPSLAAPPLAAPSMAASSLSEPPPSSGPSSLDPSLPLFELPAIAAAVSAGSVA